MPCTPEFPLKYRNVQGEWLALEDSTLRISNPQVLIDPVSGFPQLQPMYRRTEELQAETVDELVPRRLDSHLPQREHMALLQGRLFGHTSTPSPFVNHHFSYPSDGTTSTTLSPDG
jgi:hypothetical protein